MDENSNWDLRQSNLTIVQIVAAIGVIFSHSYRIGVGGKEPLSEFAFGTCTCGTIAVAIFLFLSGFCVSQSYSSARGSIKTVAAGLYNFVIRRFLRIFPVVAFSIVVCTFCLGPFVSSLSNADYFSHPLIWRYLRGIWLHSFHATLPGVFAHNEFKASVNGSLWVIPWQMWCYWLVALFGVLGLHKNRRLVLVCCSLAWALFYGRFVLLKGVSWPGGISVMQGSRLLAFFLTGWVAVVIPIALLEYWTIECPMKWLSKKLSIKMKSHEQN